MIAEITNIDYPKVTLKRGEEERIYEVEIDVGEGFIKLGQAEVSFNNETQKICFVRMVDSDSNSSKSDGKNPHIVKISGKDFMTYEGLLAKAHEKGLFNMIITESWVSEDMTRAWCKVRLTRKVEARDSKTKEIMRKHEIIFDGFGSSTPENTGQMTQSHPVEMAHTHAKGRALRDYLNIGQTMYEELKESKK